MSKTFFSVHQRQGYMASRLEIRLKKELFDAEGAGVRRKAREYFGLEVEDVRVIRVLTVDVDLSPDQLEQVRAGIFTNPVTEESSFSPMALDFDWLIWIGFLPGVRDTQASTAKLGTLPRSDR
jgi:phosphoribosylformylglycinamidine synthase